MSCVLDLFPRHPTVVRRLFTRGEDDLLLTSILLPTRIFIDCTAIRQSHKARSILDPNLCAVVPLTVRPSAFSLFRIGLKQYVDW